MRAIADTEQRLWYLGQRAAHVRVTVSSHRTSAWSVDLTDYLGRNWVRSVEWGEDLEAPLNSATIRLTRELWWLSLAPKATTSKANRVGGNPTQLLKAVRRVKVETQIAPLGTGRDPDGEWTNVFEGYVSTIDWAGEDEIVIVCRDDAAFLQDTFIEEEQPPKAGATNWYTTISWPRSLEAVLQDVIDGVVMNSRDAWAAGTAYTLGAIRRPTTRNELCYRVTTVGMSGGSEPTWPTTIGATVADGGVTWTCHSELPTVYTPTPSAWNLNAPPASDPLFRREPLLDALRRLTAARGWDLRYRWDDGTSAWRLTLYDPREETTSVDGFGPDFFEVLGAKIDIAGVRNAAAVVYPDGTKRELKTEASEDADSIAEYGRRYCELSEASNSAINTSAEAQTLADTLINDLSKPWAEYEVRLPLYPWLQGGDVVQIGGGHRYWEDPQTVIVTSVQHKVADGELPTTTIRCREMDEITLQVPLLVYSWARLDTRYTKRPNTFQSEPARTVVQAYQGAGQGIGSGTDVQIEFDEVAVDKGGDFDAGTSTFVAPATGLYAISATAILQALISPPDGTTYGTARLSIRVGSQEVASGSKTSASGSLAVTASVTIGLSAGQSVTAWLSNGDSVTRTTLDGTTGTTLAIARLF